MSSNTTTRKYQDTSHREIVLNREFDAPRQQVFDAWTAPEKIGAWWGPDGFSTTTKSMSFAVGGAWIFTMHGPNGTDYPNRVEYTDIKSTEYIKYDPFGHKDKEGEPPHFRVTVTFEDMGAKTKITMKMIFPSTGAREQAVGFGAIEGGKQTLGCLAVFLKKH